MWRYILIACLVIDVCGASSKYFDCRRRWSGCKNLGECDEDGVCHCGILFTGDRCEIEKGLIEYDITRQLPCQNGGSTIRIPQEFGHVTEASSLCYCAPDYFGRLCENKRAKVLCSEDMFAVTASPYPGFRGALFIDQKRYDKDCKLHILSDPITGVSLHTAFLNYDSKCLTNIEENKPEFGDITYTVSLTVQDNPIRKSCLDMFINASCVIKAQQNGPEGLIATDQRVRLPMDEVTSTANPLRFLIQQEDGNPIPLPLRMGTALRFFIYSTALKEYSLLKLMHCDTMDGQKNRNVMIENGCTSDLGRSISFSDPIYNQTAGTIVVTFAAFTYSQSSSVSFECDVKACKPYQRDCDPYSCDSPPKTLSSSTESKIFKLHGSFHTS